MWKTTFKKPEVFLMAIFPKFYLVHSWIVCPICYYYVEVIFPSSLQFAAAIRSDIITRESICTFDGTEKTLICLADLVISLYSDFCRTVIILTCVSVKPRTCRLYANVSSIMFLCLLFSQQSCTLSVSKFKVLTFTIDFNICSSFQKGLLASRHAVRFDARLM